jgi:tetratricopeptide (TPR) repeat protein
VYLWLTISIRVLPLRRFGLGNVYMKTGKYRMAEYHFRKAVEINSTNAMLVCCVGTVLEKLDRKKEALELYEQACLLAPTSPAVRFKRVRMLMDLKNYDSALRDLMLVRDMAPDEFNVHYLLGKLYGAMGDRVNMTRNLTIAQDLEPRAAGRIREIIEAAAEEGMDADEENEEDEDDDDDVEISVTRGRRNVDGQAGEGEGDSTREEIQGDEGTETEASEDESMS